MATKKPSKDSGETTAKKKTRVSKSKKEEPKDPKVKVLRYAGRRAMERSADKVYKKKDDEYYHEPYLDEEFEMAKEQVLDFCKEDGFEGTDVDRDKEQCAKMIISMSDTIAKDSSGWLYYYKLAPSRMRPKSMVVLVHKRGYKPNELERDFMRRMEILADAAYVITEDLTDAYFYGVDDIWYDNRGRKR